MRLLISSRCATGTSAWGITTKRSVLAVPEVGANQRGASLCSAQQMQVHDRAQGLVQEKRWMAALNVDK